METRLNRQKLGARANLTDDRILQLDSNSTKRYRERVKTVIGYRAGAVGRLDELEADEERRS